MPRAKRTKHSLSTTTSKVNSHRKTRSSAQDAAEPEQPLDRSVATLDLPDDDGADTKSFASRSRTTDDDGQSVASTSRLTDEDPALFDEEETPAPSKQKQNYYGGGGYDALKSFNGQMYSGMAIGGSHTWNYDQGVWKETKEEPDLWKIDYKTRKRRARNAPKGSGAPVGTEYHWLIVAHQYVKKIDTNTYETHLTGSKYKLAHKNVNSNSWSVPTVKRQREREILLLEDAKRRVEGLPPVLANEKVKVKKGKEEKGQATLDSLFAGAGKKRKREDAAEGEDAP